jgi:hypothetical protein
MSESKRKDAIVGETLVAEEGTGSIEVPARACSVRSHGVGKLESGSTIRFFPCHCQTAFQSDLQ